MISIDRLVLVFERVLPPAKVNLPAPHDCAAPLAESSMRITSAAAMTRSVWSTSSERTSSTSAALLMWAASLAARGLRREP
jgi:hypothetical protein